MGAINVIVFGDQMTEIRVAYLERMLLELREELRNVDAFLTAMRPKYTKTKSATAAERRRVYFASLRALEQADSRAWRALAAARGLPEPPTWPEDDLAWTHWKRNCEENGTDPYR